MTSRVTAFVPVLTLALALTTGLSGCLRPDESRLNEEARKELVTFLRGLESGMSLSEVETLFGRGKYRQLTLRKWPGKPSHLAVATPIIWGAGNWVAGIDFERDVIATVRVRTQDSVNDHPAGAPADRTFQ